MGEEKKQSSGSASHAACSGAVEVFRKNDSIPAGYDCEASFAGRKAGHRFRVHVPFGLIADAGRLPRGQGGNLPGEGDLSARPGFPGRRPYAGFEAAPLGAEIRILSGYSFGPAVVLCLARRRRNPHAESFFPPLL